jgi:alpha-1,2-mannosyltransferase
MSMSDHDRVQFADLCVNTFFYRKPVVVSWNIVKYNIFSETGGPSLYGTEPWTFYLRNLALNFNLWFVLALLALPLFLLQKLLSPSKLGFQSALRTVVFVLPFYMWLAIFTLQPHKEERFMYPAYPFLALNAAISSHVLLSIIGGTESPSGGIGKAVTSLVSKVPAQLRLVAVAAAFLLGAVAPGLLRTYGLYTAYSAPLRLYSPLADVGGAGDSVCFGKEWYRFPASYFLPRDMHAKFIRSEFRGLLPGEFSEARTGFGVWSGTWLPTSGLNDRNEEDMGKYVEVHACDFLVDTQFDRDELPPNEPDYVADANWEVVRCEPFLDAAKTPALARMVWVPDFAPRFRRAWGRHCLLRRVKG